MTTVANASSKRLRNRTETPVEYTWNLDDIYTGWDEWEADRTRLDARITEYAALKGTLS